MEGPQQTENGITMQCSNPTTEYIPQGNETSTPKDTCVPVTTAALLSTARYVTNSFR